MTRCGSCGSGDLSTILDLGMQPLPQARKPGLAGEIKYPLRLVQCERCTLVQLDYIVPQMELFPRDYPYTTGNTQALRTHFGDQAHEILRLISDGDLVVDIGANDGTMLSYMNTEFMRDGELLTPRVLAVEPTDQAEKCRQAGVPVVQEYFTSGLAARIRGEHGRARVIVTSNTFGHIPDPHDFLNGIGELLADDGTFIIDNQDWFNVVNDLQIDTIYHEHLRYYSPASLSWLLAQHGLLVVSINRLGMHGGSFRAVSRWQKLDLEGRARRLLHSLHHLVEEAVGVGPVYAVTAPTRATPLVNAADIGRFLTCACEISGSEKIGGVIPGTKVPVVDEKVLFEQQPPFALILAWDIADSLIPKLRERGYKGKFIIPLREPRIADE